MKKLSIILIALFVFTCVSCNTTCETSTEANDTTVVVNTDTLKVDSIKIDSNVQVKQITVKR